MVKIPRTCFRPLWVLVLLFSLSLLSLRGLFFQTAQIPDKWDGLLAGWTIKSVQDNLIALRSPFTGNSFYPHSYSIAFSDTFVSSALLTLPLRFFTNDPVRHLQANLFLGLWLTSSTAYLFFLALLHGHAKNRHLIALTLTIIFSWSQAHFHYIGHLHVFGLQFVFLALASLLFFLQTRDSRWIIGIIIGTVLQAWQSIFPVYVIALTIIGTLFFSPYRQLYAKYRKYMLSGFIVFLILTLPVIAVYADFYQTYHSTRDIREVIHFSMIPADLFGKFASPTAYGVIGVSVLFTLRKIKKESDSVRVLLVWTALFFFILCFGPALHLGADTVKLSLLGKTLHIPLPYAILYYLIPGFQAFRTPSRFFPFALLFALGFSAVAITSAKLSTRKIWIGALTAIMLSLILLPRYATYTVPLQKEYPRYVQWLASREEQAVLYLPMYDWVEIGDDHLRMLYMLEAKKKLINGQSGFYPPKYVELLQLMKKGEIGELLQKARALGAELVIVDSQNNSLFKFDLPKIYQDSQVSVYKI